MKTKLFALFVVTLLAGCGESSNSSNNIDRNDAASLDEILAAAIDKEKLQRRNQEGEKLYLAKNTQTPFTGWVKEMYANGQLYELTQYKEGKPDGSGTKWYQNGQKMSVENYKYGMLVSAVGWKPNGEKCTVTNVKDGNGVYVIYNEDGTEKSCFTFNDGELGEKSADRVESASLNEMILIEGQTFLMGNAKPAENGEIYPEEGPVHKVEVSSFWIDKYEVTNAQFKEFVDATGYITFAEKPLSPDMFPLAPKNQLLPGATVFAPPPENINPRATNDPWNWWSYRNGASWRKPEGGTSSIRERMDHPVVCVNVDDARAYAKWAGKRLPTEAEWELAARGGLVASMYVWGNEARPDGKWLANCFQGNFPAVNTAQDGFHSTSPVGSFPPNGFGLYDMAGNVWEICSDFYHPSYYTQFINNPQTNPSGPAFPITQVELEQFRRTGTCPTPMEENNRLMDLTVSRGGSFLCHWEYCLRYRPAARNHSERLSPSNHTGFRCAKDG